MLIDRFYLKEYLSFDEIHLEFQKGLVVFSGPSGAGKSILMGALLSNFGFTESRAKISELCIDGFPFQEESFGIEKGDEVVIKQLTSTKTRYFLNNQTISKRLLKDLGVKVASWLHHKDSSDFENQKLLEVLDFIAISKDISHKELLDSFGQNYHEVLQLQKKLDGVLKNEKELDDLIEYAKSQIQKIEAIDPKEQEYDELKTIKDDLSKKEKLEQVINEALPFLQNTHKISHALMILDQDSGFFDDAINEVNNIFEKFHDKILAMEDLDIESVLDRIEKLSALIKRFGSIQEAIAYKEEKKKELEGYENISFEKSILEKNIKKLNGLLQEQAQQITKNRKSVIELFSQKINYYLKLLYLDGLTIVLEQKNLDATGCDKVQLALKNVPIEKVSSGELNRVRLAFLTARANFQQGLSGILFLDEVDANLSGKESESIAKVLIELAKNYQIFAISHQPQLSAAAHQHFIVQKQDNISTVKELDKQDRINEIARMISGKDITKEALDFATTLLK